MSGSGREALPDDREWSGNPPDVREALSDVRECSVGSPGCAGGPFRCPGVVKRLSQISRSGREAFPDFLEWSGGPPGCPGLVERLSRMSESG